MASLRGGLALVLLLSSTAWGAVADFRVNEVYPGAEAVRFVELFAPASEENDNCLFPTTRLEVYDANGSLLGAVAPFETTVCFPGNSYVVFATPAAAAMFGIVADAELTVSIPAEAGQVCLASSQTRYDCARWGPIATPVRFFRNPDDDTSGPGVVAGTSLARVGDTGQVVFDFVLQAPTPRRFNDGTVTPTPDAGPPPPDAALPPDAAPFPDAPPFSRADGRPFTPPDARPVPAFLTARPGGGGCAGSAPLWWLIPLLGRRRNDGWRRTAAPRP